MDNIYFFNAHGERNSLDARIEIPEGDKNIFITLAYPGYTITSLELLVCLCAFKDKDFVNFFNESIQKIQFNSISDFKDLYSFERQVESSIIQTGWQQANKFLKSNLTRDQPFNLFEERQESSPYPDYEIIEKLVKYMSDFIRPNGSIDEDSYKSNSAFFLTFYFRNPTFNLSIADYSYSTHIYSGKTTEKSGLNPMRLYDYDLNINIPERKFKCDNNGKIKVNKLIRQMYSQSLLPTKQELRGRFNLQCIDGEHLALSNYSISSTSQFIDYVSKRLSSTVPNVIFMANCSVLEGLDYSLISLVRKHSFSLRKPESEKLNSEILPIIKNSDQSNDDSNNNRTTFDKPQQRQQKQVLIRVQRQPEQKSDSDSEPKSEPEPESESESEPESKPQTQGQPERQPERQSERQPEPESEPNEDNIVNSEDNYVLTYSGNTKPKTKLEYYKNNTKKMYEDKKKLAKNGNSNIIVSIHGNILQTNFGQTFSPEGGDKFFVLTQNDLNRNLTKIVVDGLSQAIKLNVSITPELIITYGLVEYFKTIKNIFNTFNKTGYKKASDFYNQYFCRSYEDYRNKIMDLFVEWNRLETDKLEMIVNNPTDLTNFNYIQAFVLTESMQKFINRELGLTVEPTNLNYKISHLFSFSNITTGIWSGLERVNPINPINYWFVKMTDPDINIQIVKPTTTATKSKYLKYKEKYLNLSKQARSL
jgi:hypothetical protein